MNTEVRFINLTPHQITLRGETDDQIIEPSGKIARVEAKELALGATANGIPVVQRKFGDVEGIPERAGFGWTDAETDVGAGFEKSPRPGELAADTIYIVSAMVLAALSHRRDVAAPDTGDTAIRNAGGHIIAVTQLIMHRNAVVEDDDCAF